MRNIENYEPLGLTRDRDSAEHFYRQKTTGQAWIRSYSLRANSPEETWMPLEGDCNELFLKWRNGENMQEYATMKFLEKMDGKKEE